ncbi:divalent metal cation transporter [Streptococcus sp. 27098_8_75]|jgi:manganese transporter NRAMP|uniref:NRAMP family divalent metal transporter n=1 Tax=Streptococcus TaxID=1301 RepID=UPI001D05E4C9|nr:MULTISPECIES: NRAMP family divalent metal transporter [Streptococcus]MBS6244384.1 divalent metal cation transporter [Streptococcus sp.]MCB6584701.1 divalent metal cation transporter [Streptococcus gordonii]MCB7052984.1 divalent metal cation transporter [Streptococcus gordonii]MCB7054928.1 divalent metal cation transporter [Streptococcus gordonii]MCG4841508.1 divalent metal cation transporter [Streptococcus gordonii]
MIEQTQTSTWQSKIKALGPGILMASAAVGGSHIVSSAQAGAMYGWSLLLLVILTNLFKYPFFRFGAEYTLETGKNLVEGYAEKGKVYLGIFFILNVFSALVNTAAVGILCAAIVASAFPNALGLSITQWSLILIVIIWAMLLFGGYKFLDGLAKWIMSALTLATVLAVIVAIIEHPEYGADFVEKTPWQMTALPFIVSLMGWMPAPIEISAINSLWTAEKGKTVDISIKDGLFDFNVGFIGTAILAVFFVALGALIQYPTGQEVQAAGAAYIQQFVGMYASVLGDWSRFLITFIAFLCIFGTVITVIDGYSRVNAESLRLLFKKKEISQKELNVWMTATSIIGGIIIYFFQGSVAPMLRFAMIASFLTTPFFALLNYLLVTGENKNLAKWLKALSILGLIFLFGFAFFFIYALVIGKAY